MASLLKLPKFELLVEASELASRLAAQQQQQDFNLGRPLFSRFRQMVDVAEKGAAAVNPMGFE